MSDCAIIAQNALGGAESTSIDVESEKDRGLIREAIKRWPKRWRGLSDGLKDQFADALAQANARMLSAMNSAESVGEAVQAAGAIASIARTAVAMEGQNQTDYWNNDKNERLDSGKATERMSVMPQITLRGIADGDSDVLPVSEDGVAGGNGVALPPIDNGEVTGK